MHNLKPTVILRKHGKRITEPRIRLLGYLINNPKAHTLSEIEERFGNQIDRVTIYRSLKIFISIGVVMKFINSKATPFFIYKDKNKENVSPHPHMRCVHCDRIICLPALPGDYLQCLDKYKIDPSQFYAEGVCQDCSTDEKQSYQKK
jgi:Fur family ferric uptake transcriptional regulator